MIVSKAARRYAAALLQNAIEQNSVQNILDDMTGIKNTIEESRELQLFLKSPIIKPTEKQKALSAIFGDTVSKEINRFLTVLSNKGRENLLLEVANAFIQAFKNNAGIITIDVKSAKALSGSQQESLKNILEKATDKKVELNLQEVEELKGGLAVKINDTVIDGTVKHKLEQLENKFLDSSMELN